METIATSFGMIRRWTDGDARSLETYGNNRLVWRNMRDAFPHPYTAESARGFLQMVARQNPTTFFAIATPDEAIGGIGVSPRQDVHRRTAELGYWLAEPFWGRGIASEAVLRFSDRALTQFDLLRIHAEAFSWNTASTRVLEKAGFVFEGRLRNNVLKDGQVLDSLMYAKLRDA